ncbi:UNVERIFIED_CONTAM: hypothetical protein N8J90_15240 [Halobacillus marinus]
MAVLLLISFIRKLTKKKVSEGEAYTPLDDVYEGRNNRSTLPDIDTHRKAPYEERDDV